MSFLEQWIFILLCMLGVGLMLASLTLFEEQDNRGE
jgi:hypothetical protein